MKPIISYQPEIGDKVLLSDGRIGVIKNEQKHVGPCGCWWVDIYIDGECVECPDGLDLSYDENMHYWTIRRE